jgi:hypothetical protein
MKPGTILLAALVLGLGTPSAVADGPVLPLRVLYVGKARGERAADYTGFLRKHFQKVTAADRAGFDPAAARDADVVLLDWSQDETNVREAKSPFGELREWSKPTVLLGSAGLLLGSAWQIIGGAG